MWPNAIALICRYWHVTAIACLVAFGAMQTMRLKAEKRDHQATKTEFELQRRQAQAAQDQQKKEYDDALSAAKKSASTMVAAAEKHAWKNYVARYGMGDPACRAGLGIMRALPATSATGAGATESSRESDAAPGQPVVNPAFVDSCGRDAARLNAWIELCTVAKCEVISD